MQADEDINSVKLLLNNQLKKESSLNCKKLKSGGIHGVDEITFKLFTSNCPFTTKEEIVEDRIKHPPYGSNLVTDTSNYTKFSKTSGTSSNPLLWLDTTKDWNHMLEAWEIIFNHAGLNPKHDKLFFAFSFGPFLGFWTAYDAAAKMNFMTIPGGGLNSNARLKLLADTSANVADPTLVFDPSDNRWNSLILIAGTERISEIEYISTFQRHGYGIDSSSMEVKIVDLPEVIGVFGTFEIPSSNRVRVEFGTAPDILSEVLDNVVLNLVEIILDLGTILNGLPEAIVGTAGESSGEIFVQF